MTDKIPFVPFRDRPAFYDAANCRSLGPEMFHPTEGNTDGETAAKKICFPCEVREECLLYALEADERFGIWGGATEAQRRGMKRRIRGDARTAAQEVEQFLAGGVRRGRKPRVRTVEEVERSA